MALEIIVHQGEQRTIYLFASTLEISGCAAMTAKQNQLVLDHHFS